MSFRLFELYLLRRANRLNANGFCVPVPERIDVFRVASIEEREVLFDENF